LACIFSLMPFGMDIYFFFSFFSFLAQPILFFLAQEFFERETHDKWIV
jgi:hypothetical protein